MAGGSDDTDGRDEFGWMYGEGAAGPARGTGRPGDDPEPTRKIPTQPRPGSETPPPSRGLPPARPVETRYGAAAEPPRTARPSGRSGWSRPSRWAKLVGALIVLWIVYLIAVPIFAWNKVDKVDFEPTGHRPADQPGTTYLIVGSDSRSDLTKAQRKEYGTGDESGQRTDTILLLHTGSGPNLLVSIPRDTLVDIPGHGSGIKINEAYADGGPTLLTKTIEQLSGVHIDHYVEIGFLGVVDTVDAVGGVEVCPKHAIHDKPAHLRISKGCQNVDGATALAYSRSRHASFGHSNDDFARVRRQREVISALGKKVTSPWSVINPFRYWRINMAAPGAIAVGKGMSALDAVKFARAMTSTSGSDGRSCTLPVYYEPVTSDLSNVRLDAARDRRLFKLIKTDRTADLTAKICNQKGLS